MANRKQELADAVALSQKSNSASIVNAPTRDTVGGGALSTVENYLGSNQATIDSANKIGATNNTGSSMGTLGTNLAKLGVNTALTSLNAATPADPGTETPADPGTETPTSGGTDSGDTAYQNALNEVLASYQKAEQERANALQKNYEAALAQVKNSYDAGRDSLQQSNDEALRQAYISYMLGQRGLNQQLSNGGINGGATESVLANLYNNYGNNRASINNEYQNALADLVNSYNSNVTNLGTNFNTNFADALADYNNQVASVKQSYANNLANRLNKSTTSSTSTSTKTETDPVKEARTNAVTTASKFINNPKGAAAYAQTLASKGYSWDEIDEIMFDAGISPQDIQTYLSGAN